jgi:hypothetical protein
MKRAAVLVIALTTFGCSNRESISAKAPEPETVVPVGRTVSARQPITAPAPPKQIAEELTAEEHAEMEAIPPPIVGAWCIGKLHSGGCVPGLEWTGVPSVSGADAFVVRAVRLKPNVSAVLFYGDAPATTPSEGGMLCVGGTVHELPPKDSGGSGPCDGSIEFDFNAWIRSGSDPSLVAGAKVFCQVRFRDDADPAGFGTGFTHALRFIIQP